MKFFTLIGLASAVSMKARQEAGDGDMVQLIMTMQSQVADLDNNAQQLEQHFADQVADMQNREGACVTENNRLQGEIDRHNNEQQEAKDAHAAAISGKSDQIDIDIADLRAAQDPVVDDLNNQIRTNNDNALADNQEAERLNASAAVTEQQTRDNNAANLGVEKDLRDQWAADIAAVVADNERLDGEINELVGITEGQAVYIDDLQRQIDNIVNIEIPDVNGLIDDTNEVLSTIDGEHAGDQERARKALDDARERIAREQAELSQQEQDLRDDEAERLAREIQSINDEFDARIVADVEAHVARSENTVFEVCTRIERDANSPGNFKVETVTHGDVNAAAEQIQALADQQ